jgi:hypothetical protein
VGKEMKTLITIEVENETGNPSIEDIKLFVNQIIERGFVGPFDIYNHCTMSGISIRVLSKTVKTVRAVNTNKHGHTHFDIVDEYNDKTGNVAGWIIDDEYFIATRDCPRFDPRDGSTLKYCHGFDINNLMGKIDAVKKVGDNETNNNNC